MRMNYRPEIDGLRAFAVLPVILFHAGAPGFDGGFVGVDVFFVISGYLITRILLDEMAEGRFSVAGFYERRARRILPALFLVILACVPFAAAWMLPFELVDFSESVVAAMLFVSNVLFYFESDYFAAASGRKPLLHTWSLGVEEQFYLLFPLLLFVAVVWLGWRDRRLLVALGLAALASLVVAEIGWRISRAAAFFLTPTRVWELLLGAILAAGPDLSQRLGARANGALAAAGLTLILGSVAFLSDAYPYPSLYTLAPTVGAALVLAFAKPEGWAGRLLCWRGFVAIGLVSYSAYLWHQPIFAFFEIRQGAKPGPAAALLLIALTFGLAGLTWRFVEAPFRDRRRFSRAAILRGAAGGSLALVALGLAGVQSQGLLGRFAPDERYLASFNPPEQGNYTNSRFKRFRDLAFDADPATPNVLIVGDSYARDFINAALENGYLGEASVSTLEIPAFCGIVLRGDGHEAMIEPADRPVCGNYPGLYGAADRLAQAEVVILAASWRDWVIAALPETLAEIAEISDARIVVVSRKSFGPIEVRRYLDLPQDARIALRNPVAPEVLAANAALARATPEGMMVDIPRLLCGGPSCQIFTSQGRLLSYDGSHLTADGARELGRRMFALPALADLR